MRELLVCTLAVIVLNANASHGASKFAFEARDPKSQELLFRGYETITLTDDGRLGETTFIHKSGEVQQSEQYRTDKDGLLVKYSFEDSKTGEQINITRTGEDKLLVTYVEGANKTAMIQTLPLTTQTIHGKGLPELIRANWDDLHKGKVVTFDLIVAQRLETISFQARLDNDLTKRRTSPVFVVEASNWLIRQFAPSITLIFDTRSSRRLVEFIGPAAIVIDGERHRPVSLTFCNTEDKRCPRDGIDDDRPSSQTKPQSKDL